MDTLPKEMRQSAVLTVEKMPIGTMFYVLPWDLECDQEGNLAISPNCDVSSIYGGTREVGLKRNDQRELTVFIPRLIDFKWDDRKRNVLQGERITHIKVSR